MKITMSRAIGPQRLGELIPLTTAPHTMDDAVEHLPAIHRRPAGPLTRHVGVGDGLDQAPQFVEGGEAERGAVDDGLPFDASLVSGTVISMTCFVAMALLKAAIKVEGKSLVKRMLDRIEEKLTGQIGVPKMVRDIRRRIEHILDGL